MIIDPENFPRVELDFMNRVHAEEVGMLNRLAELVGQRETEPAVQAEIDALLDDFLAHMRRHFGDEEAMMRRINFPPYPVHKQEHDRILTELETRLNQAREQGDTRDVERYLLEDVPAWFDQHVATMDMITARFLQMQGVTGPDA